MPPRYADLEGLRPGFRNRLILFSHTATAADGADNVIALLERNAAGENHDPSMIGGVNPEELVARLGKLGKLLGWNVESPRGPGFVDGDIYASDPGLVHADVSDQVAASVDDGDIHRLGDFFGFSFGRSQNAFCICECDHYGSLVQ